MGALFLTGTCCRNFRSGGLELLFNNQKDLALQVPVGEDPLTLDELIMYILGAHLKERPELFVQDGTV